MMQPAGSSDEPAESPPPAYGSPYPPPRRTNSNAVTALVVALAGLVACPLVGVIGVYLGNRARKEIARTGEEGDGMALAGIIVGWIGVGLTLLIGCVFAGVFGWFGFVATSATW